MSMEWTVAIWAGFVMDCLIGDPEHWWHPVRGTGWLIERLERQLRRICTATPKGELTAGVLLVLLVTGLTTGLTAGILFLSGLIHPGFRLVLSAILCCQFLAAHDLRKESLRVCQALQSGDLNASRQAVSRIVGRDTEGLTAEGVAKAAVETVAENTSDGVIAPLFWMFLLGPVGGAFYKAVNTMDSMVGYRNEKYLYFGRAAARLDDLVNWIPARITALLLILAAWLLPGMNGAEAFRIWRRDRHCHKSPNSAQGEAACAGALGLLLGGDASYFGALVKKPTIGEERKKTEAQDILHVNHLMYTAVLLALILGTGGILWLYNCMGAISMRAGFAMIFL